MSTQWKAYSVFVNNAPNEWHVGTREWGKPSVAVVDTEEHAKAIAAAPELLDALKLAHQYVVKGLAEDAYEGCALPAENALRTISAAIDKAEGR